MAEIENNLGVLRRRRGLSAVELAAAAGVARQTIYAVEAGTYVPNTAVALRLARTLEVRVEELFALTEPGLRTADATLLEGTGSVEAGQALDLCEVDGRLIASSASPSPWWLPVGDAVADKVPGRVRVISEGADFSQRILLAGCDPGIMVLSRQARSAGIDLVVAHRNSTEALKLLKQGCVHVAGTHLRDEASGESNLPEVVRHFGDGSVAVISFALWEEGIVAARGNPKGIGGIEDFARPDVSVVNREEGSGSRALLDSALRRLGIDGNQVRGYSSRAAGHMQAAWNVLTGVADCCVATKAAATALGLHFIPLITERYDLVVKKRHLESPRVQALFDVLNRAVLRQELESFGGYDTSVAGRRIL